MSVTLVQERTACRSHLALRIVVLMGCIGLVGGIPLLLVETQATPPLSEIRDLVAHPTHVRDVLETRVSDGATLKLLWLIAWLTWGWFMVCAVVETVGRAQGRAPGKLPGSRYVQWLAKCLIGASLAFGFPSRQLSPLRLQVVPVAALDGHGHIQDDDPRTVASPLISMVAAGVPDGRLTLASSVVPASVDPTYVVKPRDTLWSIAGTELGSPLRWRQLAAANYGRQQPDGEELTNDHWIRPGWVLIIPILGSAPGGVVHGETSSLIVSKSPAAPTAMEDATGPPDSWKAVPTTKRCAVEASSSSDCGSVGAVESHSASTSHPDTGRGPSGPHVPILPIGFGLLGAGIVALLDRMRRAQQRLRPEGLRIALPEGDLIELERGLRLGADSGAADWVDLSMRLLSANVRRGMLETPIISAVLLRDDVVEVILQTESLPPPPFEAGSGDKSWILRKSGQRLDELRKDSEVSGIDAPLPSLVTLGRDSQGIQMINIEIAGSVAVSGPDADSLVHAVAVELATAQWADQIDLVLVGFGEVDRQLERVNHANSLSVVSAKMKRRVQERAALLATIDGATNSENRWREGGDSWDLCVVICSSDASADESGALEELIDVAGNGSFGVVVICGRDTISARWRAKTGGGLVSVDGVGLPPSSLSLQSVPQGLVERVSDLVAIASQTAGVAPDEEPYGSMTLRSPESEGGPLGTTGSPIDHSRGHASGHGSSQPSDPKIVVRVLGPVDIIGAARQFTRAWAMELIVYLAVHPGGVSNDQWATALWPEKTMAAASLHSTASAARRSLGTSASGEDHLPRSRGRLALGPDVHTDWDVFVDLSQSPAPDDWREAMNLIVGRPFDGLRSPDWVVLEGIQATVEAGIVDLTCRYARHCLEALDAPGAEWAARQGLRVSPYDERLYRVLLHAADAAGNPAGVESVMAELVHLVADDIEPFDAVHPETIALYRKLSRRTFATRSR